MNFWRLWFKLKEIKVDKKKKRNKKKPGEQNDEKGFLGLDKNPVMNGENDNIGGQAYQKVGIQNGQVDMDRHKTNERKSLSLDLLNLKSPKFIYRRFNVAGFVMHFWIGGGTLDLYIHGWYLVIIYRMSWVKSLSFSQILVASNLSHYMWFVDFVFFLLLSSLILL